MLVLNQSALQVVMAVLIKALKSATQVFSQADFKV